MSKRLLKPLLSVLISALILGFLFKWVGTETLFMHIKNINPLFLLCAGLSYLLGYLFRGWRFYILLKNKPPTSLFRFWGVICMHNMFNKILPARTGEFSYLILMRKYLDVQISEGVSTLLISRLMDLVSVCLFFFTASILLLKHGEPYLRAFIIISAFGIFTILSMMLTLLLGSSWISRSLLKLTHRYSNPLALKLLSKISDVALQFGNLDLIHQVLPSMLISMGIWISIYLLYLSMIHGMNIQISVIKLVWGSTMSIFSSLLPISGVGGFGTHEAGWTAGLLLMGVPKEICVSSGFLVNVMATLFAILFGVTGYLMILGTKPPNIAKSSIQD